MWPWSSNRSFLTGSFVPGKERHIGTFLKGRCKEDLGCALVTVPKRTRSVPPTCSFQPSHRWGAALCSSRAAFTLREAHGPIPNCLLHQRCHWGPGIMAPGTSGMMRCGKDHHWSASEAALGCQLHLGINPLWPGSSQLGQMGSCGVWT